MSFLLITHDLAVAFSVCDQVLVLYAGSTLEYGPSQTSSNDRPPVHGKLRRPARRRTTSSRGWQRYPGTCQQRTRSRISAPFVDAMRVGAAGLPFDVPIAQARVGGS